MDSYLFQVIVIPYRKSGNDYLFAVFRRSSGLYWQWVSGGGHIGEKPEDTALREMYEETGILLEQNNIYKLITTSSIPIESILRKQVRENGKLILPEYAFAVQLDTEILNISKEHSEYRWLDYQVALDLLKWDSNKTALWELKRILECVNGGV